MLLHTYTCTVNTVRKKKARSDGAHLDEERMERGRGEREETDNGQRERRGKWEGADIREEIRVRFEKVKKGEEEDKEDKSGSYTRLSQLDIDGEQQNTVIDKPISRGSFSTASESNDNNVDYENQDEWMPEDHPQDPTQGQSLHNSEPSAPVDDYVHMLSVHEPKRVKIMDRCQTLVGSHQRSDGAGKIGHSMERTDMEDRTFQNKPSSIYQKWAANSSSSFKGRTLPPSISRATAVPPATAHSYKNIQLGTLTAYLDIHASSLGSSSPSLELHKYDPNEHVGEQASGTVDPGAATPGKKRNYVNIDESLLPPEPTIKPRQKQVH